jgi:hypothetical protein
MGRAGRPDGSQLLTADPNSRLGDREHRQRPLGGWQFADKSGTPNNTFLPGEFFEGGIDVTALSLPYDLPASWRDPLLQL